MRERIRENAPERRNRASFGQVIDAKVELRNRKTGRVIWLAALSCERLTEDRDLLMEFISEVVIVSLERERGKSIF